MGSGIRATVSRGKSRGFGQLKAQGRPLGKMLKPSTTRKASGYQEHARQDPGGGKEQAGRGHRGEPAAGCVPLRRVHGGGVASAVVRAVRQA